jgi:hypothetical protein
MEVSTSKVIVDALVMPWRGVALRHEVACGRGYSGMREYGGEGSRHGCVWVSGVRGMGVGGS